MSLHHLFQSCLDGVEGEAEVGVAAAECQLSPTGAPDLSRLAIDCDWCPQQEKAVVVCCVRSEAKLAWDNLGMRWRLFRGHGCCFVSCVFRICSITTVTFGNIPLGSLCQMSDDGQLQALCGYLKGTVTIYRQPAPVMYMTKV